MSNIKLTYKNSKSILDIEPIVKIRNKYDNAISSLEFSLNNTKNLIYEIYKGEN